MKSDGKNNFIIFCKHVLSCSGLKATGAVITTEHTISVVGALHLEKRQKVKVRVSSKTETVNLIVRKESSFMVFPLTRPAEQVSGN